MNVNNYKLNISMHIRRLALVAMACVGGVVLTGCEGGESSSDSSGSGGSGGTGRGGSTARMTISENYLYAIAGSEVKLFDISEPKAPNFWTSVYVDWDIETLFPYGDYLLIGAAGGMHIMDNSNRASPQYLAEFTHATARDPVVAHKGYAYVTLRSDGWSNSNQLDVIDIQDINNPSLVKTIAMREPSGLSVATVSTEAADGQTIVKEDLYVCDDAAGIRIFDLSDPASPAVVDVIPNVNCNDVLADRGILYVITDSALLQYDYTSTPPVLLSKVTEGSL